MGEVVTKFTGDTKDLEAAYARLQKEVLKTKEEMVKLKKESKDGGSAMKGAFGDALADASSLVTGMFTVSAAVGVVKTAYDDWAKTIDELAKKNKEFEQGLLKTLQKSGDLAKADQVEKFFGSVQGITRQQMRATFESVSGATPASSLPRRQELAQGVAGLAPTGIDLAQAGAVAGELSDMTPGKSGGDIADIVAKLQSKTGADFAKFSEAATLRAMQALVTSGAVGSPEAAMGLGIAAHDANLKPNILENLAQAATKTFDRGELKGAGMAQFSGASAQERMRMMQSDPEIAKQVLGDEAGLKFAMLPGDAAAKRTQELMAAQTGDYAQQAVATLDRSKIGLKAQQEQSTAVQQDKNTQGYWAQRAQRWAETDDILKNSGESSSWARMMAGMRFGIMGGGTDAQVDALKGRQATLNGPNSGIPEAEKEGLREYLAEQTGLLRKIEANQNKRQLNINAHNE